jgi:hypothetical protein
MSRASQNSNRKRSGQRVSWRGCPLVLACLLMLAPGARADPVAGRLALVLGESAYTNLPPVPGCTVSSQGIAERLRQLGFDVTGRADASNGVAGAALIDVASRAGGTPDATVVVYFCGYAVAFEDRVFLLPVSAVLDRASDALTQGVPAQSLLDLAGRNTRASLIVLDTYDAPGASPGANAALAALIQARTPSAGHFVVAATETAIGPTATPLAQALSAGLAEPPVDAGALVTGLKRTLAGGGISLAVAGDSGGGPTLLAPPIVAPPHNPPGLETQAPAVEPKPPPLPSVAPAPQSVAPAPQAAPAAPATAAPTAAAPAPAAPEIVLPEEEQYTVADRRRVQAALRQLGYYDGTVDGVIGPETRAAIRRYQHELGAPMTGRLSAAQATRLVAGAAQGSDQGGR